MRRMLATESINPLIPCLEGLSLEEADVMADEAQDAATGAETELAEAERTLDVTDALEDIADIAEGIEEATPAETQLIDAAASVAVAGEPDVAPEDVMPAMEGYVGRRIAVEGIRERAKDIWKQIQSFLKKIWAKIEEFFYKYIGEVPRLRKNIDALKKKVEECGSKSIKKDGKTFEMTSGVATLTVDDTTIKNSSVLKSSLEKVHEAAKFVFVDNAKAVAGIGEKAADIISNFDEEKPTESAKAMIDFLSNPTSTFKKPSGGARDGSRMPGYTLQFGSPLMGNKSLAHRQWNEQTDMSEVSFMNRLRHQGLVLISTKEKPKEVASEVKFDTMSTSDMYSVIAVLEKVLDTVEEWRRGSNLKKVLDARKALEKASDKASAAAAKLEASAGKEDDATKSGNVRASAAIYKELLNVNASYARWAKDPAAEMISTTLASVRVAMALISKSCSQYESK